MMMMNDLSGCPEFSVFFDFQCRVLKGVQKVTKTVLLCVLSSFPLPNGLEMSPFTECDVCVIGVLKGIRISLCKIVMKELNFLKEVPHGDCRGLERSQFEQVSAVYEQRVLK